MRMMTNAPRPMYMADLLGYRICSPAFEGSNIAAAPNDGRIRGPL